MSGQQIAFIGCRLLAIYWGLEVIYSITDVFDAYAMMRSLNLPDAENNNYILAYRTVMSAAFYLVASAILWFGAKRLSVFIANGGAGEEQGSTSVKDIQALIFSAVGLFILMSAIPGISGEIYKSQQLKVIFGHTASLLSR